MKKRVMSSLVVSGTPFAQNAGAVYKSFDNSSTDAKDVKRWN